MTSANDGSPDRGALVYQYHERLYRLALMVSGDMNAAAALLQRAYRELPAAVDDAEAELVRALLPTRPSRRRWRWAADDGDLLRSTLDRARADALLDTLARLMPAERLAIGLAYLSGCSPEEIGGQLGPSGADLEPADLLARWRAAVARAVDLVPADADPDTLLRLDRWIDGRLGEEDAIALRRAVLEQPDMRALRDGMIAARELLPRAIPALFAAAPPPTLAERLLKSVQVRQPSLRPRVSARWAQAALALGVLALTAAIIGLPSFLARRVTPTATRRPAVQDMIDAAVHRFDRAPLRAGVLHEQYVVERANGVDYVLDRWYDYASPNRLAISVRAEGHDEPLFQISSDGRSLVQFRDEDGGPDGRSLIDAHVSEDEAQAILPLLRAEPLAPIFPRGPEDNFGDLGPLYLAQARAAGAAFLGMTTMLDRQAFLLTYRTARPPLLAQEAADQPAQVVLTIDAQTYSLLDVALISEGAAESSARHPLQARQFEVLADVPDERFKLPSSDQIDQRTGIGSVRFPELPDEMFVSLDDAARRSPRALLAPQQLPDMNMRGLVIATENGSDDPGAALLYEGEFQNVVVFPGRWYDENSAQASEERSAGEFRYRILRGFAAPHGLTVEVYRADDPEQRLVMILDDEYATGEEREVTLRHMIASLTPVDEQSLPALRRNFQPPGVAAGKG